MTRLQTNALARHVLNQSWVESMYDRLGGRADVHGVSVAIRTLCESHERLRAELQGAEIVIEDLQRELEQAKQARAGNGAD